MIGAMLFSMTTRVMPLEESTTYYYTVARSCLTAATRRPYCLTDYMYDAFTTE